MPKVLIIDDDKSVPKFLQLALQSVGHDVEIATDPDEGLVRAVEEDFDVVITDLHWGNRHQKPAKHPGPEKGLELIQNLHKAKPTIPVILMTAFPAMGTTIDATKRGAYDYIPKPGNEQEMDEFVKTIRKAAEARRSEEAEAVTSEADRTPGSTAMVGKSPAMQKVLKQIGRIAAKPVSVLIRGETGTGKELVAAALHRHSGRKNRPFIIVNCANFNAALLESELFGHEPGAFTGANALRIGRFEQADGGTICLDEIGDISLAVQAKLLRVLQDHTIQRVGGKTTFEVDVRVIAATHRDLETAVEEGKFRRDLYYRLNDAIIHLPPLRERKEDIPELANLFLQQDAAELGAVGSGIDPDAIKCLKQHSWAGNVRELRNAIRKALLLARGLRNVEANDIRKVLDETRLFYRIPTQPGEFPSADQPVAVYVSELLDSAEAGESSGVAGAVLEWAEREIYSRALRLADGDQTKVAEWLGVSRPTVRQKLWRYKLRPAAEELAHAG
jgi:DNA-binding NtrC family response regulator